MRQIRILEDGGIVRMRRRVLSALRILGTSEYRSVQAAAAFSVWGRVQLQRAGGQAFAIAFDLQATLGTLHVSAFLGSEEARDAEPQAESRLMVADRLRATPEKFARAEACLQEREIQDLLEELQTSNEELVRSRADLETTVSQRTVELHDAKERAEEAARAKSMFLANMSHEIRTPMNGIIGLSDLALRTALTEQQKDYLKKIHFAGSSLLLILNDLLDLSKVEAGYLKLERVPFEPQQICDQVKGLFGPTAERKGLRLMVEVDPRTPDCVVGDPLRLSQILTNLVSNALKFTKRGGVRVRIMPGEKERSRSQLRITVSDSGIGIKAELIDSIFAPFQQGDPSTTRQFGGTGLGLSICKHLAGLMQGKIEVKSELGRGSSFRVTVWVDDPSDEEREIARQATPIVDNNLPGGSRKGLISMADDTDAGPDESLQGLQVLLVEDNEINQQIAEELLRLHGAHVEVAQHGQEALACLAMDDITYDVILMDLQMPVMDGYEATRVIREDSRFAELPIYAMTAHALDSEIERCLQLGMQGHIAKPFSPAQLFSILSKLPRRHHLHPTEDPVEPLSFEQDDEPEDTRATTAAVTSPASSSVVPAKEEQILMPTGAAASSVPPPSSVWAGINGAPADSAAVASLSTLGASPPPKAPPWTSPSASAHGLPPSERGEQRFADASLFDIHDALTRVAGQRKLLHSVLQSFLERRSSMLDDVLTAKTNLERADLMHAIKGVAGNLGAQRLFLQAAEIEHALRQQITLANSDWQLLSQTWTSTRESMARWLQGDREEPSETAPSTPAPGNQVDASPIDLSALRDMLQLADLEAEQFVAQHHTQLVKQLGAETVSDLRNALQSFDFESAARLLPVA